MTPILGKKESQLLIIKNFVESIVRQFDSTIFLSEEHINKTDKLKKYRQYEDGDEVKAELAFMLNDFTNKYKSNNYIVNIDFHASQKPGLSNYIEIKFNTPFGSKEWLKHLKIRISDHPKHNDRKIDEYIYLEGKSVEDIEKDLDKIINKRIRRLQREDQLPTAQNESIGRNNNMKLRINEDENTYEKFKDKYILFNRGNETEFDNYEEAVEAYKSLNSKYKFLYQPDKRYFFCNTFINR